MDIISFLIGIAVAIAIIVFYKFLVLINDMRNDIHVLKRYEIDSIKSNHKVLRDCLEILTKRLDKLEGKNAVFT